jgi:hypothetical protein
MSAKKALRVMPKAAMKAIVKELINMSDKSVFKGVDPSKLSTKQRRRIIRSSMFIKEKYRPDGSFEKLKARLVAGGHMQVKSELGKSSSPVINTMSVHMIVALAAKERRHVKTADISAAFLNAEQDDEVLMLLTPEVSDILCEIDSSYESCRDSKGCVLVHLNRAIYGLVTSSYRWFETLCAFLVEQGYVPNAYDPCVYNKTIDGVQCTVGFHVDDLLITCINESAIDALTEAIKTRFGGLTIHSGKVHNYVGGVFDFTVDGEVSISMPHYTKRLVEDCGIQGRAPTPAADDLFVIDESSELLNNTQREWYHSYVHRVLYLANRLNGECLLACSFLTKRVQKPTVQDMQKLVRLLQYLNKFPNLCLTLRIGPTLGITQSTDASYGVHADGKSHSGTCIQIGEGGNIMARSTTQAINTKSSTEAELVALSDEASRGLWCNYFLEEQGYVLPPVVELQDNMSTISMAEKGAATAHRTRHIRIRYFWVTDYVDRGEMCIQHMPTDQMVSDGLTKPLQGEAFIKFRNRLLCQFNDVLDY